MPNLKDLKIRIDSVKSTRKITKAMQMVAAAKLRKAQEQAERGRPYAEKMRAIVSNLASSVKNITLDNKYLGGGGDSKKFLLIIATAERGLCGGFNSSIVKLAKTRIAELKSQNKEIKILTIGKKGREQLNREFESLFVGHVDLSEEKTITIYSVDNDDKTILDDDRFRVPVKPENGNVSDPEFKKKLLGYFGEYIEKDESVEVSHTDENQIVVKKV